MVLLALRVVPEGDRHRREGFDANQFTTVILQFHSYAENMS